MGEIRDTSQMGQAQHASADPTTHKSASYEYDAFISYRRRDAMGLARWIRDRLQRYNLPPEVLEQLPPEKKAVHERRPRVWLDKAFEKPSDDFLTKKIYPALDRSARLIVISTPSVFDNIRGEGDTKEPNWLEREIDRFLGGAKANLSPRPIDVVLGPGGLEDRFPGRLTERNRLDWIDCRRFNWWRSWGLSEELDAGLAKLVAGLYDVPETQLPALRQEEQRRRNRWLRGISILALAVTVIIGLLGLNVWQQKKEVELNLANSLGRYSLSLSHSNQEFDALIEGIKAGKILQRQNRTDAVITSALARAVHGVRERNRLTRHTGEVKSVAFSPDGQTLASASQDTTIKLWDLQGKELQTLEGHTGQVTSVAFSPPDGQTLASASQDTTIKLWKRNSTGQFATQPDQTLNGHAGEVNSVAFSPDSQTLASASHDTTIKLWKRDSTGQFGTQPDQTLRGHAGWIWSVTFSPGGQTLASASQDRTVKLWKRDSTGQFATQPDQTLTRPDVQFNSVTFSSVTFSRDGQTFASASQDSSMAGGSVYLWKRNSTGQFGAQPDQTLRGPTASIQSVTFSPDGKTIASANASQTVHLWKRDSTGQFGTQPDQTLRGHAGWIWSVTFSPDGQTLASASQDRTVKLWTLEEEEKEPQTLTGHTDWVRSVAFSPNGETLATAGGDTTIKLWNLQGKELQTLGGPQPKVRTVAFSPDDQIFAAAGDDTTIYLWKRNSTGQFGAQPDQTLNGHADRVNGVAFSHNGETLATAGGDTTIKLWNLQGKELQTLRDHQSIVRTVAFSPDKQILASASQDTTIKLWKRNSTGQFATQPDQTLNGHAGEVNSIAFSPDGQTLASASHDTTIKLWKRDSTGHQFKPKPSQTLRGHTKWVTSVAFSPDKQILASAGQDGTVKLWTLKGEELQTLYNPCHGEEDWLRSVAFSPDGKTIVAGGRCDGRNRDVILWSLDELQLHKLMVTGCAWLRDYLMSSQNRELKKNCQESRP